MLYDISKEIIPPAMTRDLSEERLATVAFVVRVWVQRALTFDHNGRFMPFPTANRWLDIGVPYDYSLRSDPKNGIVLEGDFTQERISAEKLIEKTVEDREWILIRCGRC